ncbi:MAG: PaaI family thioesterase, partial [Candidatus Zixiibacteriota bacterium]
MEEIIRYSGCFVCGTENPIGLKLRFWWDGSQAITEVAADKLFEGYRGIYHGGIIATVLDEIMVKAILATGKVAVTAEMTVRYHRPVRIGDTLSFRGRITKEKGPIVYAEAEAVDSEGNAYATA